jgi:ATP-dependent helicase/nuclease subunit A
MPTATLTSEQAQALATRNTSVALAAGAGCGKTFVLTERFLSHLRPGGDDAPDPAQLSQLIAITFTDAAAREMRSRIRSKCYERLQAAATTADQDYWLRLLRAIEAARVSTIHAFCASLLRANAIAAGVDPAFGVLDQGEADVLVSEMIDDVLRGRLAAGDDDVLDLAAECGLAQLKQQLRELLKYRHEGHFSEWSSASPEAVLAAWQTCHATDAFPAAVAELAQLPVIGEIAGLLATVDPPAKKEKFVQAKTVLLELLPLVVDGRISPEQLQTVRSQAGVQRICTAKDWPDKNTYDQYRAACETLRKEIDRANPQPFDPDSARAAAETGLKLLRLATFVADAYEAEKSQRAMFDYDDLLAQAYRLLSDPEHAAVRQRLADDLQLLLVDEFQDTDQLQVDLVRALCGDQIDAGKLFFVGDFKQSIYRFRGAQPQVFQDLRAGVSEPGRLPLTVNFRSQPAVIHFVNALFCRSFGDQYEPLQPHRQQATPEPAVEFLWAITPDKSNRQLKGAARAAREQEAGYIARRLRGLIDSEARIIADAEAPGGTRSLRLGDVAILFRALSDIDLYELALREYELDYYLVGGHAFYAQQEIYDVLNLLRAVASPADEVSLAGVLRSPFFSLADETLFWLVERAGSLNEGLFAERLPAELSPDERTRTARAAETLRHLRRQKDLVPIATLLAEALARTGYDAALLAEFLGERKLANLHKLLEQARAADQGGLVDLAGFIAQLAEFVAREPKEPLAATLSESADVVRLMTIHHAKGLEFPLVVVADLDRKPDFRSPPAALDSQLGPLVALSNDADDRHAVTGMDLFRALEKRADADERIRLLYVATTRAADYLILASSLAGYEQLQSDWMQLLATQFNLQTGELRGPAQNVFAAPNVAVIDNEPATDRRPVGRSRKPDLLQLLSDAHARAARGDGSVPREALPIAADVAARRQFSVSRLTGQFVRRELEFESRPMSDDAVDPRELGVLVHAVLERIRLQADQEIDAWCERLAAEIVTHHRGRAAELAREMVNRLVQSSRWSAMATAAAIHREVEFLLAWPPAEFQDEPASDGRYLQGYIDCLYQDADGGWHLVDYKTNDVTVADASRLAEQYEMQMYVYALAAERSLGRPPVEVALAMLRPGVEHAYPWNDAARRRGMELVKRAMEALVAEATSPTYSH